VVLQLRDGHTGQPITADQALPGQYAPGTITVVTDSNGFYQFTGLAAGVYAVFEVHPAGYIDGRDTPGSHGGVAVNPDVPIDPAILAQLQIDPSNDAILAIDLGAGQHATEYNFSEIRVEPFWFPTLTAAEPAPRVFAPPVVRGPLPITDRLYAAPELEPVIYGGSSQVHAYTWHLSVIDAGQPRGIARAEVRTQLTAAPFAIAAWRTDSLEESHWTLRKRGADGDEDVLVVFGHASAKPVVGDFNGDGMDEVGAFLAGEWYIDVNGNGRWDDADLWAHLGHRDDLPITGDWDGDGKTDIGIFGLAWPGDPRAVAEEPGLPDQQNFETGRRKNLPPEYRHAALGARRLKLTAEGSVRSDVIDHVFHYGVPGDMPITGDWNGDGIKTIGVYRDGKWYLDVDGDGKPSDADTKITYGQPGDLPLVGDWNGEGIDQIGVYRNGTWYLDADGNSQLDAHDKAFEMGAADDLPVVGDWDGDGVDDPGVFHGGSQPTAQR
jgi:hypothetical protein